MAVSLAGRLAGRGTVPVQAVVGAGAREAVLTLRADDRLELVASPRHASVLLVAGAVPDALLGVVAQVHDQLPEPRAVVWWDGNRRGDIGVETAATVAADDDVGEAVRAVYRELVAGRRASTPAVGLATNPVEWRGLGPHGQGGEGMMGGQPYGRAMAMTDEDLRDGLQLDQVYLRLGPTLPGLPPGLVLDLAVQGDVVQHARIDNLLATAGVRGHALPSLSRPFDAVHAHPVAVAEVEVARARLHVLRVAEALALSGLDAAARRAARLGVGLQPADRPRVGRLQRWFARGPGLWGATAGVGVVDAAAVADAGIRGVTARAAGVAVDERAEEPVYRGLGFAPTTRTAGDARARWLQRLDEAQQALRLAQAAGGATVGPGTPLDDPRDGGGALLDALPEWLSGMELGDAVTLLASLDLDLDAVEAPLTGVQAAG